MKENNKVGFEEFIINVSEENKEFITEIHNKLINQGCKIEVKSAKSGYVVSYIFNKKTVLNYVFRKSGLLVRIYATNVNQYMSFLDSLPVEMVKQIKKSTDCKRLIDKSLCNQKCAMGYDFLINNEIYQKCKNNAFMFQINNENNQFIKKFLMEEMQIVTSNRT